MQVLYWETVHQSEPPCQKIWGKLLKERVRCWDYMEEVPPKADLTLIHQHQILQLLARGGLQWGNTAGPVSAQMQDGKYPNNFPNEREIQQVYRPVHIKRRKKTHPTNNCVWAFEAVPSVVKLKTCFRLLVLRRNTLSIHKTVSHRQSVICGDTY